MADHPGDRLPDDCQLKGVSARLLIVTVCNIAIAIGAIVGGVLVGGVSADAPLLIGGIASIAGAAVLVSLRRGG